MKTHLKLVVTLGISGMACAAVADITDATRALQTQPYMRIDGPLVPSSVLPGFYGLAGKDQTNPLKGMVLGVNEVAALVNGSHGHQHLVPGSPQLTDAEEHAWMGAVMRSIDTSRLIAYKFGSGERKIFVVTAYDCPSCIDLEKRLSRLGTKLDATVYLVPIVLNPVASSIAMYNAIACSSDPAGAWRKVMLSRNFPTKPLADCGAPTLLDTLTVAIALGELATPAVIQEDGRAFAHSLQDDAVVLRVFGASGKNDLAHDVYAEPAILSVASAFVETVRPVKQERHDTKGLSGALQKLLGNK